MKNLVKLSFILAFFGVAYINGMQRQNPLFIPPKLKAEQHSLQNEYASLYAKKGRTAAEDRRLHEIKSRLYNVRLETRNTFRK